jgi:phosphate/sulfate permease
MMGLFVILIILGWVYERARKRNNLWLAKLMVAIGALFIGANVAMIIVDFVIAPVLLHNNRELRPYVAAPLMIISIVATYLWLMRATKLSAPKKEQSTTLDADLMEDKTDNERER